MMKWLRENSGVISLLLVVASIVWGVFGAYGDLAKMSEVKALRTVLESGTLKLAECVDNSNNARSSGPDQPFLNCENEVHRALRKGEDR